jgi:3-methyladenine DNA glycosylase AlkD
MSAKEIVAEMKKYATEQTKRMWLTHGAKEPCIGVKIGDMKKIQKRIKMDYQLALDLYDTGIADAMYLAGLIADDAKMTKKDLQRWVENATWGMVGEYSVAWVASGSPHGREMAVKWIASKDERIAASGWATYSSLVSIKDDAELDLAEIKKLLGRVAETIHDQPSRVRYVMNGFVIAVGCFVKPLHKLAVETAKGIGKVTVELVGDCTIPYAPDYIKKVGARRTIGKKRKSAKC